MIPLLADTHVLVWAAGNQQRLPEEVTMLLEDRANQIYFSLVSIWEVAIKFALGRDDFDMPPDVLRNELLGFGFLELAVKAQHVIAVAKLPHHHRDPFDRLLVAQAETEGLTLMTTDKTLARYGPSVKRFR